MRNANSFSKKVALKYLHEIWWVTLAEIESCVSLGNFRQKLPTKKCTTIPHPLVTKAKFYEFNSSGSSDVNRVI
jgi:hypothetical protein